MRRNLDIFWMGLILIGVVTWIPQALLACDRCYEDERSAVYSYSAVKMAQDHPEKYEFLVFKIKGIITEPIMNDLNNFLKNRPDVEAGTVKVSTYKNSMSFLHKKTVSKSVLATDLHEAFPQLEFQHIPYPR